MTNKYVNKFLNLKCAGDIIGIAGPMKKYEKEITEAMSIREALRKFTIKEPMQYTLVDLCSGNALVPLLAAFTLPVKKAIAVDIRERNRPWHMANRFEYITCNIREDEILKTIHKQGPVVITACHACKSLATQIIDIFGALDNAKHLIMMPCCIGQTKGYCPPIVKEKLGRYLSWSYYLSQEANGELKVDNNIISPCNALIIASK